MSIKSIHFADSWTLLASWAVASLLLLGTLLVERDGSATTQTGNIDHIGWRVLVSECSVCMFAGWVVAIRLLI